MRVRRRLAVWTAAARSGRSGTAHFDARSLANVANAEEKKILAEVDLTTAAFRKRTHGAVHRMRRNVRPRAFLLLGRATARASAR